MKRKKIKAKNKKCHDWCLTVVITMFFYVFSVFYQVFYYYNMFFVVMALNEFSYFFKV